PTPRPHHTTPCPYTTLFRSHVGPYAITQGTLALSSDYALSYVGDTFTVGTRPVTVTADANQHKTYGEDDPALTYAVTAGNLITGDPNTTPLNSSHVEHAYAY